MSQYFEYGTPRSTKKRYQTPLHLNDMLRIDGERRVCLEERARRSSRQQKSPCPSAYKSASRIDSWTYTDNGDAQPEVYLGVDEAAIKNDLWLPYERPFPNRDNDKYWKIELEHVSWDGITLGGEVTPARQASVATFRLLPHTTDLDDPFISPARPHAISPGTDQYTLHSPMPQRPVSKKSHSRGRSLLSSHAFLENGQMYHPQLHLKRTESVPNYSRPLTPECHSIPKRGQRSKQKTIRTRHSDQAISYERVNGIYLDSTPRSTKERREDLSIPEIEARDLVKLDEWLQENVPAEAEFAGMDAHPARPPPPIGGKENSVRTISPQPPSAGKHHTFVSRYSWTVDRGGEEPPVPALVTSPARREQDESHTNASYQVEPARMLLTEIIQGILGSAGTQLRPDGELYSGENDAGQPDYAHHDYPPDYNSLQPRNRPDNIGQPAIESHHGFQGSVLNSQSYSDRSYRKRIESLGRNAIKFMSLGHASFRGRCAF